MLYSSTPSLLIRTSFLDPVRVQSSVHPINLLCLLPSMNDTYMSGRACSCFLFVHTQVKMHDRSRSRNKKMSYWLHDWSIDIKFWGSSEEIGGRGVQYSYKMSEITRRRDFHCLGLRLFFFLVCLKTSASGDQAQDAQVSILMLKCFGLIGWTMNVWSILYVFGNFNRNFSDFLDISLSIRLNNWCIGYGWDWSCHVNSINVSPPAEPKTNVGHIWVRMSDKLTC